MLLEDMQEYCTACRAELEIGQIGRCDECQEAQPIFRVEIFNSEDDQTHGRAADVFEYSAHEKAKATRMAGTQQANGYWVEVYRNEELINSLVAE